MSLQRLVLTFKPGEVEIRALYRRKDGPSPGTKARRREVSELAREGLTQALEALEGRVDVVGESGFQTREDVIVAETQRHRKGSAATAKPEGASLASASSHPPLPQERGEGIR